jgi:hypothetical protein
MDVVLHVGKPMVIPVKRLRQEGQKFKASLHYIELEASLDSIVRHCLKINKWSVVVFCKPR